MLVTVNVITHVIVVIVITNHNNIGSASEEEKLPSQHIHSAIAYCRYAPLIRAASWDEPREQKGGGPCFEVPKM
eukprot:1152288-Pelagomonas_calceolata.AAC.9